jgi:Fe-S oxidoreductase
VLAYPVNAILASRTGRWFLEKLFGVSQRRRLPRFAAQSFLRRAARKGWTQKPTSRRTRVVYFVDVFANYNDPTIGEAAVAVLQHNGIEVYVPPGQVGCGIAPLAYGDVDTAREAARVNVRLLADLARQGYRIVCSEPSAALMLRHDYLDLLDEPDTRAVAEQVVEFTAFLDEMHGQGRLRVDFRPLDLALGHHVPCHLKALRQHAAAPGLLQAVPGVRVRTIDVHCSGIAGTFGLKAMNYATSVKAGQPLRRELARPDVVYGSSECSTCRMQMEDLSEKRALHPAQYLALAYGYLPELRHRLDRPFVQRVL